MKPIGDEVLAEMAVAAAMREQRNRPTALVVIAVALLASAVVATAWGLSSRASAVRALRRGVQEHADAQRLIDELASLRRINEASGPAGEPIPDLTLWGKLDELATSCGLPKPQQPTMRTTPVGRVDVKTYTYQNVRSENLGALLEWVRSASESVPGLEVFGVQLRSDATGWTLSATFRRLEHKG